MLPWWVGVAAALVSYLVLHALAKPVPALAVQPNQIVNVLAGSMVTALTTVSQYIVPLICLGGAGMSAWKRHQRQALIANVAQAKGADALDDMTWREFEALVGEAFRLQGYRVAETGGGGTDGGVDLVLFKGAEKFFVQCKKWKSYKVGVEVVRELYGVMAAKGATGGFLVTSGSYTGGAQAFADGRNVELIDGKRLHGLIKQAREALAVPRQDVGSDRSAAKTATRVSQPAATMVVTCPVCDSNMVRRRARKGPNAGDEFWGCSKYPGCRGTRPLNG